MHNKKLAEWLLRRFTDDKRAASIVGDLHETAAEKGTTWFWWAYASVIASVAWRPTLAVITVAGALWFSSPYFGLALFRPADGQSLPGAWPMRMVEILAAVGAMSWFIFIYCAVRYGIADRVARLSLGFAMIGTLTGWFWWAMHFPTAAAAFIALLFAYALFSNAGRRSFVACASLWLAFVAIRIAGTSVFVAGHMLVGGWDSRNTNAAMQVATGAAITPLHNSIVRSWDPHAAYVAWFYFCYFLGILIACAACSRVHRALLPARQLAQD